MKAGNLSSDANEVKKALDNSTAAQENAEKAINRALNHTAEVNKLLADVRILIQFQYFNLLILNFT